MHAHRFSTLRQFALSVVLSATPLLSAGAAEPEPVDPARIAELTAMLSPSPRGVGRPIGDRQAWRAVAAAPGFQDVVADARQVMSEPIPELTDDLFLDYSRTGNRTRCQRVLSRRHYRVSSLVLAECIENRGRFLPAIEEAIREVCSEKTWVMPAHDRSLKNFNGSVVEIDLAVVSVAWNLATVDYWLAEKLSDHTRKLIRSELERRIFTPFTGMVTQGEPRMWWLTGTNNWNAVCLAGVTGTALTMIDSPERRAFFIAAAEKYIQNFLHGFTDDGYCSEGIGYWNYGFGNYVSLAETVCQATGGKLDLFDNALVARIARFGRRMEIEPGLYPAFADCRVGSHPDPELEAFLSRRYGWGMRELERRGLLLEVGPTSKLFELGLLGFANSATARPASAKSGLGQPLHDWFEEAGILIARPAPGDRPGLGVALKGGHNAEHHNHNDVGSFVVALAGATPIVDPGSEVYTARTFSSRRYESGVLNSFGHSVPRVAGQLQRSGREAAARLLQRDFTDRSDTLVLDLRAAYDVEDLKELKRSFIFSRRAPGSLVVIDEVRFASEQEFGTALVTFSKWRRAGRNRLVIGEGPEAVQVEISTGGRDFEVSETKIEEDLSGSRVPTRLGIDLDGPVTEATITMTITPRPRN